MDLRNPLEEPPAADALLGGDPLAARTRRVRVAELLPLGAVRLSGPLREAQDRDAEYVLALDVDRLAAPYRREAGLPAVTEGYGNWEGDGMGGHLGGHVLSAASLLVAASGDERVRGLLDRLLDALTEAAAARDDGFLGGVPGGAALADELRAGRIEVDLFDLNGRWVPLYNLHKTLSGLLDAVVHAGERRALPLATGLADWWLGASAHLDDEQFERLLRTEFGGMTEALATLGALTGDERYVAEARRFLHREVLDPLLHGQDALDGLHANTQIPKVVGYEVLGQLTDDAALTGAAEVFWRSVVRDRTVALGGNSVREHFHARDDFSAMVTDRQGPESCNTVNMVELSTLQYLRTGRSELVDFVERALLNHVLASQHPGHGGLVYFTPVRPAHYRVYSRPETSMWCCVGSGIEAHARHGALVAVRGTGPGGPTLDVLLHVGAEITDRAGALRVDLRPAGLGAGRVLVEVRTLDGQAGGVLRLRRPSWSPAATAGFLPGQGGVGTLDTSDPAWFTVHVGSTAEGPLVIELDLPADVHHEPLPDGSPWAAFVHGPLVLAAGAGREELTGLRAEGGRMGHVAAGPLVPLARTPVVPDPTRVRVHPDGTVTVAGSIPGEDGGERETTLHLVPFATLHDQRYTVYWPTGDAAVRRRELRDLDETAAGREVVDEVTAGEQQPEADHHVAGSGSAAGRAGTAHWRSATGWFSYRLVDPEGVGRRLVVRHRDTAGWSDVVLVDGGPVEETGVDPAPGDCVDHTFDLPPVAPGAVRVVLFRAAAGGTTRDVVSVRLLR